MDRECIRRHSEAIHWRTTRLILGVALDDLYLAVDADNVAHQPCSRQERPPGVRLREREFKLAVTLKSGEVHDRLGRRIISVGESPQVRHRNLATRPNTRRGNRTHTRGSFLTTKERCEMRFGYRTSPSRRARSPSWNGFRMKWSIRSPVKKVSTVSLLYALVTITFRSGRVS